MLIVTKVMKNKTITFFTEKSFMAQKYKKLSLALKKIIIQ